MNLIQQLFCDRYDLIPVMKKPIPFKGTEVHLETPIDEKGDDDEPEEDENTVYSDYPEDIIRKIVSSQLIPPIQPSSGIDIKSEYKDFEHSKKVPKKHHKRADDFALFLVLLTITGFFGLMLSVLMPFAIILSIQQSAAPSPQALLSSNPVAPFMKPRGSDSLLIKRIDKDFHQLSSNLRTKA